MDNEEVFESSSVPSKDGGDGAAEDAGVVEEEIDREAFMSRYGMTPEKFAEWKESLEIYKDHPEDNPLYYVHPPIEVLEEMEREGLL